MQEKKNYDFYVEGRDWALPFRIYVWHGAFSLSFLCFHYEWWSKPRAAQLLREAETDISPCPYCEDGVDNYSWNSSECVYCNGTGEI